MADLVTSLLQQRRGRVVASIMGSIERSSVWGGLSKDERADVRDSVVAGVNGYHELALDVLKVYNDGHVLINEQAIEMIRDLHDDLMAD